MDANQRREKIIKVLNNRDEPISGNELSEIFNVTRQVIVQDIAFFGPLGRK